MEILKLLVLSCRHHPQDFDWSSVRMPGMDPALDVLDRPKWPGSATTIWNPIPFDGDEGLILNEGRIQPQWLLEIFRFARKHDCRWIQFDPCEEVELVEELEVFPLDYPDCGSQNLD